VRNKPELGYFKSMQMFGIQATFCFVVDVNYPKESSEMSFPVSM